uniref:BTB domain-containing protein n=2 Tax=Panagrellus redivivus TaxID=6233 RepID=A0A7E4V1F7_PANRE
MLLQIKLVTDSYSFEIPERALSRDNGAELTTEMRPITQIEGLEWCIEYSPAGLGIQRAGFLSVFIKVTKPIAFRYVFGVKNTAVKVRGACSAGNLSSSFELFSHDELRNSGGIQDGKFVITCDVEFEVPIAEFEETPSIHELLLESCPQIAFVVGKDTVKMNKAILTSVSSVFHAMFSHDMKEARTDSVKVTDFDVKTIENVNYFCLGIELDDLTTNESIQVLKFADKYDIKGLQTYLESFLVENITADNFCDIVNYAWTHSRDFMKTKCARYFSMYGEGVFLTSAFADLEPTIMASLVKAAVGFKSK